MQLSKTSSKQRVQKSDPSIHTTELYLPADGLQHQLVTYNVDAHLNPACRASLRVSPIWSGPALPAHVGSSWVGQHTLFLLARAAVFGIDEEQRRLGVMADDFTH